MYLRDRTFAKLTAIVFSYAFVVSAYPFLRHGGNWSGPDYTHLLPQLAIGVANNQIFGKSVFGNSVLYPTFVIELTELIGVELSVLLLVVFPMIGSVLVMVALYTLLRYRIDSREWILVGLLLVASNPLVTVIRTSGKHSIFTYSVFMLLMFVVWRVDEIEANRRWMLLAVVLSLSLVLYHVYISMVFLAITSLIAVLYQLGEMWDEGLVASLRNFEFKLDRPGLVQSLSLLGGAWFVYMALTPNLDQTVYLNRLLPPYSTGEDAEGDDDLNGALTEAPTTSTGEGSGTATAVGADGDGSTPARTASERTSPDSAGEDGTTTPVSGGEETATPPTGAETTQTPAAGGESATTPTVGGDATPTASPVDGAGSGGGGIDIFEVVPLDALSRFTEVLFARWDPWWLWLVLHLGTLVVLLLGGVLWIQHTYRVLRRRSPVDTNYVMATAFGIAGLGVAAISIMGFSAQNLIFRFLRYFVPFAGIFIVTRRARSITRHRVVTIAFAFLLVSVLLLNPLFLSREMQDDRIRIYEDSEVGPTQWFLEHSDGSTLQVGDEGSLSNIEMIVHTELHRYEEIENLPFTASPAAEYVLFSPENPISRSDVSAPGAGDGASRTYDNGETQIYARTRVPVETA